MKQPKNLAMDFAVLMLCMCEKDFLPDFDNCTPDMSDVPSSNEKNWSAAFLERTSILQRRVLETHPFGKYFIEKGHSWEDVKNFVIKLQYAKAADALQILFENQG